MKRWQFTFTLLACAAFVFCTTGCDWGETGHVSTDLIHIPATASTELPPPRWTRQPSHLQTHWWNWALSAKAPKLTWYFPFKTQVTPY